MAICKAVIPAAGLGTRFLPATKAMPKEMLPVVDKPAIQYVVEEASRAGLDDVLIILGRNKNVIPDHFDRVTELENTLQSKGEIEKLALVQESTHVADVHYVRQGDPRGLGHAVLRARQHVGHEPFAVLLGDDLVHESEDLLSRMVATYESVGHTVVALMEVPPDQVHLYGVAEVKRTSADNVVRVTGLVEKPNPEQAPSNFAVIGRYVLSPAVFDVLERTEPGKGGEIQLTDALQQLALDPNHGVTGVIFRGRRFDTGDKLGYLQAVVELGLEHPDVQLEFREWLRAYLLND